MISLTSPVRTHAHSWPAAVKLGALCGATVVLFGTASLALHGLFCAGMIALYVLPGQQFLRAGLGRLRMVWPFVALILAWHLISGDLARGGVIALRMITAVGLANLVTMTTRLRDMMQVAHWLCAPLRRVGLNTKAIEVAVALVVRFTPVLTDKGQQLNQAWRARANCRVGWRIVLPFAVLAIDDAEHVAEALRARGGL